MIEKYEIRKVDKENVLILYLSYDYEFSGRSDNTSLLTRINSFIRANKIKWNGNKVIIVVGGLILGTIVLGKINFDNNSDSFNYVSNIILNHFDYYNNEIGYSKIDITDPVIITEEEKEDLEVVSEDPVIITNAKVVEKKKIKEEKQDNNLIPLYRSNGTILNIELEEYVVGVVAAEMPASFNIEALKAQSVAVRTYALKHLKENKILTDDVKTQVYNDNNELKEKWKNDFDFYYNKVKSAVESTKGQVMIYDNDYIEALYHSTSNGYTEDCYQVFEYSYPYLERVNSSWDLSATSFLRNVTYSFDEFSKLLNINFDDNTEVEILSRTNSGRVSSLRIGDNYYSGIDFRKMLGLRSTDFDIEVTPINVVITTRGYGHGVGLSQYGANGMANSGKTYVEILKHYYKGITIKTI